MKPAGWIAGFATLCAASLATGAETAHVNRLAAEASPYLQLHAHNPVDWYPWGEEAFARAKAEDKPIFLSVGYSTCYWCHVMEREVFADAAIAKLMNQHLISIKVDREERPDIDDVYMQATHLLTRRGGWPNSVFLTPEGKPFFAGTYFPPKDRGGRPGFPTIVLQVSDLWTNRRAVVEATATKVTKAMGERLVPDARSADIPPADEVMRLATEGVRRTYEPVHGGFSQRTKFANPARLELLIAAERRAPDAERRRMLTQTLDEMALGGIHDQVGGGFHRYSTEPTWSVPHFEKMLYDNAQLLSVYGEAHALTGSPLYRWVIERTADYLLREMRVAGGAFASAQDAEVGGEEGASYVWSRAEISRALGEKRAAAFFSLYELVNMHPGAGVLRVKLEALEPPSKAPGDEIAARLRGFDPDLAKLLAIRDRRPQPLRDDKVLAGWNGLAIRGLVAAAAALNRPELIEAAERAANFVLGRLVASDGSLRRSYIAGQAREGGVLDDYAYLADGLLALHRATGAPVWQRRARTLADAMLARFEDKAVGGFFLTPADTELLVRSKPFEDNVRPSGNGVALRVLRALQSETGGARYADAADAAFAAHGPWIERAPFAVGTVVAGLIDRADSVPPLARAAAKPRVTPQELPRSEDHVRVQLARRGGAAPRLVATLFIDPGWHVNANPASFEYLVPTTLELVEGGPLTDVLYPPGQRFEPEFSRGESLSVYAGKVEISAALPDEAASRLEARLRFQACDEQRCLPPGEARIEVASP